MSVLAFDNKLQEQSCRTLQDTPPNLLPSTHKGRKEETFGYFFTIVNLSTTSKPTSIEEVT
jgi:hypothetical protein